MKNFLWILTLLFLSFVVSIFAEDYKIPRDNNGYVPGSIDMVGIDAHIVSQTTTGQVAKNASVSTAVSTTTLNPCLLYGIVLSSAYAAGTDYVVIRDTHVVNTSSTIMFTVLVGTSTSVSGANPYETRIWALPQPVKFNAGICVKNSAATFETTILFRYLKR